MAKGSRLRRPLSADEHFAEAVRYYRNAKARLREATIRNGLYDDLKPVREACQTGYLAVLEAIQGFFLKRGVAQDKLPDDPRGYGDLLRKHAVHNGKLIRQFHLAYEDLHLVGHYMGTQDPEFIKLGFQRARWILERLTGQKV